MNRPEDIFAHKLIMFLTMGRSFATYIGVLGFASLIAIAWPSAVLIGLFVGLVPGILLWLAPSLFMYSLLWWITRALVRQIPMFVQAGPPGFIISGFIAALVAIPAIIIPHHFNIRAQEVAQLLRATDVESDQPIVLPDSTISLVIDGNFNWQRQRPYCETLCARLLFDSNVARVIAMDPVHGNPVSYWIERRESCPDHPNLNLSVRWSTDVPLARADMLEDRVRIRIDHGECLVEGDGRLEEAAATISYRHIQKGTELFQRPWSLQPGPPIANRLEIADLTGAIVYRRTEVTTIALSTPLQIETAAGFATHVGWERSNVTLGQMGPRGRDVLPHILAAAMKKPP